MKMKKSRQSSNEILAGGSIRRLFTVPVIICLVLFAVLLFTSTFFFSPDEILFGYGSTSLISELKRENYSIYFSPFKDTYTPYYHLSTSSTVSGLFSVLGIILGALQFDFLLNKKNCYTQLSFAVGRRQLYFNKIFFPILIVASLCVSVNIISVILNAHFVGFNISLLWGVILNILSCMLPFIVTYAVTIAGHLFAGRRAEAYFLIFALFNFFSAISYLTETIFANTLYGYSLYSSAFSFGTIYYSDFSADAFPVFPKQSLLPDIGIAIIVLFVVIVALHLFKLYFVKRYKAEQCGIRAKNPITLIITCTIIPILFVHACGFTSSYLYEDYNIPFTPVFILSIVACIILALIVCILSTFSPKKLVWGGISAGIITALHIALLVIGYTGCFGYDTMIPETDDIMYVSVSVPFDDMIMCGDGDYNNYFYSSEYNDTVIVKTKKDIEIVRNIHKAVINHREEETGIPLEISYTTKDGDTIYRDYSHVSLETADEMLNLWDTEEPKLYLKMLLNQATEEELKSTPFAYSDEYLNGVTDSIYYDDEEYDYWVEDESVTRYSDFVTPLSTSDGMYIISKDLHSEQITFSDKNSEADFSEDVSLEIMTALYKDACALSAKEWFEPEDQLGALGFDSYYAYSPKTLIENCSAVFYVNSKMTNTVKVLEKYDLLKYFACEKEIEKAHLIDVTQVANWIQYDGYYIYESFDMGYHTPYFSQDNEDVSIYLSDGCGYIKESSSYEYDYYEDEYHEDDYYLPDTIFNPFSPENAVEPPLDMRDIKDLEQAKELLKKAFLAYNVGDNGDFLVIKYTDGTCSMLVIPK